MDLLSEGDKPSQHPAQTATSAYAAAPDTDTASRVEALIAELRASGRDITADYGDWLKVGFALASEFGEAGRSYFHDISSLYSGYSQEESDTKYSECRRCLQGTWGGWAFPRGHRAKVSKGHFCHFVLLYPVTRSLFAVCCRLCAG